jgi:hypothetical protein
MTPDQKFFFLHVMKTAGATLRQHIRANFTHEEVYPYRKHDPKLLDANYRIDYLTSLPPERLERIRVFTGHFPYAAVELLDVEVATITVLRDPVERTLSYLRHCRHYHSQHKGMALEEIYEDPFFFPSFIKDHQAKLFALTPEDRPESYMDVLDVDAARLAIAKRNLDRVDVVGTQDHFDDLLSELERRFGWSRGDVHDRHVSERDGVPDSFRRRIAEDNAADMEFYEYALEVSRRRGSVRVA